MRLPKPDENFPLWVTPGESQDEIASDVRKLLFCSTRKEGSEIIFFQTSADKKREEASANAPLIAAIDHFKAQPDFQRNCRAQDWQSDAKADRINFVRAKEETDRYNAEYRAAQPADRGAIPQPKLDMQAINAWHKPSKCEVYRFLEEHSSSELATLAMKAPQYFTDDSTFTSKGELPLSENDSASFWDDLKKYQAASQSTGLTKAISNFYHSQGDPISYYSGTRGTLVVTVNLYSDAVQFVAQAYSPQGQMIDVYSTRIPISPANEKSIPPELRDAKVHLNPDNAEFYYALLHQTGSEVAARDNQKPLNAPPFTMLESSKKGDVTNAIYGQVLPEIAAHLGDSKIRGFIPDQALPDIAQAMRSSIVNLGNFYLLLSKTCQIESDHGTLTIFPNALAQAEPYQLNRDSLNAFAKQATKSGCLTHAEEETLFKNQGVAVAENSLTVLAHYLVVKPWDFNMPNVLTDRAISFFLEQEFLIKGGEQTGEVSIPMNELPTDWRRYLAMDATPAGPLIQSGPVSAFAQSPVAALGKGSDSLRIRLKNEDETIPIFYDLQGKQVTSNLQDSLIGLFPKKLENESLQQYIEAHFRFRLFTQAGSTGEATFPSGAVIGIHTVIAQPLSPLQTLQSSPEWESKVMDYLNPRWPEWLREQSAK